MTTSKNASKNDDKTKTRMYADFSTPFIMGADASNGAVEEVLSQIRDGKEHPVAYCSRTLTKCKRNYSTSRKELLAVVHALQKFRCYLNQTFLLPTDHAALRWLCESKDVFRQCARWFESMAEFDFKLVHRSGAVHGNADALSRCPGGEENFPGDCPFRYNKGLVNKVEDIENSSKVDVFVIDFRECLGWNNDSIARFQQKDERLFVLLDWVRRGSRPTFKKIRKSSEEIRYYWSIFAEIILKDSCLYRKHEDSMMTVRTQLLVPSANREEVLKALHDSAHGGGHVGVKKTAEKISERLHWPCWRASVAVYRKEYQLCDQRKQPSTTPKAELVSSLELSPMQRIEIDVLGGFPTTHTGKRYILIACGTYTKYM